MTTLTVLLSPTPARTRTSSPISMTKNASASVETVRTVLRLKRATIACWSAAVATVRVLAS